MDNLEALSLTCPMSMAYTGDVNLIARFYSMNAFFHSAVSDLGPKVLRKKRALILTYKTGFNARKGNIILKDNAEWLRQMTEEHGAP